MTMLEKIVYIADYIEPARNKAPRLTEIRRLHLKIWMSVCIRF